MRREPRTRLRKGGQALVYGVFTEKEAPPTPEQARDSVGSVRDHWDALADFVTGAYRARGGLRFYGRNYGWAVTYRAGAVALLALFPGLDAVTALVVLPAACFEAALSLDPPLRRAAAEQLERATLYREGRWLFIPVRTADDVEDVRRLVALKRPSKPPRG
jgi:hypothetical protein